MATGRVENLIPVRSEEEARQLGSKGGKASGEARRQKRLLKDTLLAMLEVGEVQDNLCAALLDKAMSGDTKAFEVLRDTVGQKPKEEVALENKIIEIGLVNDED